jgi:hypothetical protein
MSDYNSSLPVRTQGDATEKLQVRILDASTDANKLVVDTDGNAHVELHGNDSGSTDRVVKVSESGNIALDGDYHATNNSNPSSSALIAHDRGASIDSTSQNKRPTAIGGASNSVCLDIALHDEDGQVFSEANPLPVILSESSGVEVHNYNTASAVASNAISNHDYPAGAELDLKKILCSASGKAKFEVQIEDGVGAGTYTSKAVQFNSTANPNCEFTFTPAIVVATGVKVRVIRTNKDNQAQDLYSTIMGVE